MKMNAPLALALLSLTAAAHADWTRIEHGSSDVALYIDKESQQPSGRGSVLMWHLADYAAPQDYYGKPFRSIKGQNEYDCDKGVMRDMLHFWHQDGMGSSHMVQASYKPGHWAAPAEGSAEQTLMRVACGKK